MLLNFSAIASNELAKSCHTLNDLLFNGLWLSYPNGWYAVIPTFTYQSQGITYPVATSAYRGTWQEVIILSTQIKDALTNVLPFSVHHRISWAHGFGDWLYRL